MSQHATIHAPHEITEFSLLVYPGEAVTSEELIARFEAEQARQRAGRRNYLAAVEATYRARPTLWDRFEAWVQRHPLRAIGALCLAGFVLAATVGS